jgi:NAD(P)-dependent dehydrogenase (short-subunit alcohol dehydrogenase family)
MCKAALPHIANAGGGSVIMISSIAALRGTGHRWLWVSKAPPIQLTRTLAVEWSPKGIRVNSLAPRLVKTEFARELWEDPEPLEKLENRIPSENCLVRYKCRNRHSLLFFSTFRLAGREPTLAGD